MPGRTYNAPSYRYTHNGHEREDEIAQGIQSAEFWDYDSRTGRRWEVDPITYEWQSSYACFNNNPIWYNDPLGLEGEEPTKGETRTNKDGTVNTYDGSKWIETPVGQAQSTDHPAQLPEIKVTPDSNTTPAPAAQNTPPVINIPNVQQMEFRNNNQLPEVPGVLPNTAWRTQAPNWTACFTTCQGILRANGIQNPAPRNLAIQMTTENQTRNGLNVAATANQGLAAINTSLDQDEPVIVGVNHTYGNNYNEGTTDHFIVIVGRGYQDGRLYYRFFDVGTTRANAGAHQQNRLYLTNNNTLVGITQYNQRRYTVSQVRPNRR